MHQVLGDGGLANRLNTLLTALAIKADTRSAWSLAWPVNNWCGAPFEDLFEPMIPVNQQSLLDFKRQQDRYWHLFHENQIGFAEDRIAYNRSFASWDALCAEVKRHRRVLYFHHAMPPFLDDARLAAVLPSLRPSARVAEAVRSMAATHRIDADTIGVHIRKTDFGPTIDEGALFQQIARAAGRFFICSDSNEVLERFAQLPHCVALAKPAMPQKLSAAGDWNSLITDAEGRTYPFNVDRDRESVFWGLVDLLLLARTRIVVTSHSSFLALAQRLGRLQYAV